MSVFLNNCGILSVANKTFWGYHTGFYFLISDEQCYQQVRQLRWPEKLICPHCHSEQVIKRGKDDTQPCRQRYECRGCGQRFDDLTNTVFAGHHQPLKIWVLCMCLMGLGLSNRQMTRE